MATISKYKIYLMEFEDNLQIQQDKTFNNVIWSSDDGSHKVVKIELDAHYNTAEITYDNGNTEIIFDGIGRFESISFMVSSDDTFTPQPLLKIEEDITHFYIILYNSTAEKERLDKTSYLTIKDVLVGILRQNVSILNPVITIEWDAKTKGVPNFNYVYIPLFNRYYFVSGLNHVNNKLFDISLSVDVLMTYKDVIYQQTGHIARNENDYNSYIMDDNRKVESYPDYEVTAISTTIFNHINDSNITQWDVIVETF